MPSIADLRRLQDVCLQRAHQLGLHSPTAICKAAHMAPDTLDKFWRTGQLRPDALGRLADALDLAPDAFAEILADPSYALPATTRAPGDQLDHERRLQIIEKVLGLRRDDQSGPVRPGEVERARKAAEMAAVTLDHMDVGKRLAAERESRKPPRGRPQKRRGETSTGR